MRNPKDLRNMALVVLRKTDPEFYSYAVLSQIFEVNRNMAHKIYQRDKDKYPAVNKKSKKMSNE